MKKLQTRLVRDISRYRENFCFGMSVRQTVCSCLGAGVTAIAALALQWPVYAAVLLGFPIVLVGFWRPDGLPVERYAFHWIESRLRRPRVRVFQAEDPLYAYLWLGRIGNRQVFDPKRFREEARAEQGLHAPGETAAVCECGDLPAGERSAGSGGEHPEKTVPMVHTEVPEPAAMPAIAEMGQSEARGRLRDCDRERSLPDEEVTGRKGEELQRPARSAVPQAQCAQVPSAEEKSAMEGYEVMEAKEETTQDSGQKLEEAGSGAPPEGPSKKTAKRPAAARAKKAESAHGPVRLDDLPPISTAGSWKEAAAPLLPPVPDDGGARLPE